MFYKCLGKTSRALACLSVSIIEKFSGWWESVDYDVRLIYKTFKCGGGKKNPEKYGGSPTKAKVPLL